MQPVNLYEYEKLASTKLSQMAYDYYAGGAHDEITLRENHAAFDRLSLHYRVLRDVSKRDLRTTVLGNPLDFPVVIAPTAFQSLARKNGELEMVAAAGELGTIMTLSTLSTVSLEDVSQAAQGPVWFQLYVYKDRGATEALVRRAEEAGCTALVLTVDAQVWGRRERDARNRFSLPHGMEMKNLLASGKEQFPAEARHSGLAAYVTSMFDPSLSWKDIDWLTNLTRLPLVIKGIVHPDDARLAVDHGAAGIVISNHGGRQLDTSPATIEVLPQIAAKVDGGLEILLDGGIRRGTDVVKAIALGARAVMVGRPTLWGLAVDGRAGVVHAMGLLREEIDSALGLCGYNDLEELGPELVGRL